MAVPLGTTGSRLAVLVVEDSPDDEALTLRALRQTGLPLRVTIARTGDEALRLLKGDLSAMGLDFAPRLILLDLKLPKITGLELLREIRADSRTSSIPVVCLTSSDESRDTAEAFELGANSYIRKPIDYERYLEVVRKAVEYWLIVNYWPA